MSIIAHQSDNMTILGEISYSVETKLSESDDSKAASKEVIRTPYLQLAFVVHVNGRQKSFRHSFKLIKRKDVKDLIAPGSTQWEDYTLTNWDEWHNVMNTLDAMGYTLSDYNETLPYQSHWQISKWIETLMQYEQN